MINKENKSLKHKDKVKFMYCGELLYGVLDGCGVIESSYTGTRVQHIMVKLNERFKATDWDYSICGMSLHIDLKKDIKLCDDGYYMVELVEEEELKND